MPNVAPHGRIPVPPCALKMDVYGMTMRAAVMRVTGNAHRGACELEGDVSTYRIIAISGSEYTGGTVENPNYKQITNGGTGHREAVQIRYYPKQVSYDRLLHIFWRSVDSNGGGGSFATAARATGPPFSSGTRKGGTSPRCQVRRWGSRWWRIGQIIRRFG